MAIPLYDYADSYTAMKTLKDDVHALMQKSRSISQIRPSKLKLNTKA